MMQVSNKIIDGRKMRQEILAELSETIRERSIKPKLAIVQVGNNTASSRYIAQKQKLGAEIGAQVVLHHLDESVSFDELKGLITKLNQDKTTHGIIVQLPLPKQLDEEKVSQLIFESKDVDGFRENSQFVAATPAAVLEILKREKISLKGKVVVIVGRGKLVGRPLYQVLSQNKDIAELIQVHTQVPEPLDFYTKKADVLISAVGKPRLITGAMLKTGAVVIDVGINIDPQTDKMVGDVDFDSAQPVASKITPVPGGVGPMTVAMLLQNLIKAVSLTEEYN